MNQSEIAQRGNGDLWFPLCPPQVDEIMLTLKQAFSVAALQQSVRTQSQQCDSCPMQQLHRLCERIEGETPQPPRDTAAPRPSLLYFIYSNHVSIFV